MLDLHVNLPFSYWRTSALTWSSLGLLFIILAWLLATLPLQMASLLVLTLGGGILLIRHPWFAWVALATLLPFTSAVQIGPLRVTELALAGAVVLWFADGTRRGSVRLERVFLPAAVSVYLLALLLAVPAAVNLPEATREVIKWGEVLLVVWLVGGWLTPGQKRWLVVGLLLGGAIQGILGIAQFLLQIGPPAFLLADRFMRAAGTFHQPNPYAGYLGLTLPVAVSLALWAWPNFIYPGEAAISRRRAIQWAIYATAVAGVVGLGLVASWSRGGWLGALAGVSLVIFFRSQRAVLVSVVGGTLLLALFIVGGLVPNLIPAPVAERLTDLPAYFGVGLAEVVEQPVTDENFAVIERLAHWIAALRLWEMSPWIGVGPGNYAVRYPEVKLPAWEEPLGHAHNIYLNVLAESGMIGLLSYLIFWGLVIGWLWRRLIFVPHSSWESALQIGVLGVLLHLSVHNFFDNLFVQGIDLHVAFWLAAVSRPAIENAKGTKASGAID
jgi:putative inorganic carbon (hco3(-)) transporter